MFKHTIITTLLAACMGAGNANAAIGDDPTGRYTRGNLVATDALGRRLPDHSEVGGPREGKFVAMFYWTWHTRLSEGNTVKDASRILAEHPGAIDDFRDPAWPAGSGYYYWGEPLFDYYIDTDKWVLRRHAEMLAEAGVDVIVFDCTNGSLTWKESYMALCEVFSQARRDGVAVPQIAFLLAFGVSDDSRKALNDIYTDLYAPGKYSDLWFHWDGKPLVMHFPEATDPAHWKESADPRAIADFFTFRPGWPTYNDAATRSDSWSWLQIAPQHGFGDNGRGGVEQMAVGVAQNWSGERGLTAMNAPGAFGRSYTAAAGHNTAPDAGNWGYNFQEQWDRALDVDPDLVFVTGWNEWIAGRYENWGGQHNAFPDQFSSEYSRDIEPMKGGHGDNYYYQLVSNVRRYKGVDKPAEAPRCKNMAVDGDFAEWEKLPAFESYPGNTAPRNHPGWQGRHYTNFTGRNDIVRSKVACDRKYLYFYVEASSALTPSTDTNWMMLFINSDRNHDTGWEGYDYVVNRTSPESGRAVLEKNRGGRPGGNGWTWERAGEVEYAVSRNKMELRIPRASLEVEGKTDIEFKWVDNMQSEGDIMDFYLSGDAAPLGRFNYLFIE